MQEQKGGHALVGRKEGERICHLLCANDHHDEIVVIRRPQFFDECYVRPRFPAGGLVEQYQTVTSELLQPSSAGKQSDILSRGGKPPRIHTPENTGTEHEDSHRRGTSGYRVGGRRSVQKTRQPQR